MTRMYNPPHPGEVLREWLGGLTVHPTAEALQVSRVTLSKILNGKGGISADMALRLSQWLGTSPNLGWGCRINMIFGRRVRLSGQISNRWIGWLRESVVADRFNYSEAPIDKLPNTRPVKYCGKNFSYPWESASTASPRDRRYRSPHLRHLLRQTRHLRRYRPAPVALLGTTTGFWLGLQADYDLEEAGRRRERRWTGSPATFDPAEA